MTITSTWTGSIVVIESKVGVIDWSPMPRFKDGVGFTDPATIKAILEELRQKHPTARFRAVQITTETSQRTELLDL